MALAPEPGSDEPELAGESVDVTAAGLRFRSGPSTSYAAYGLLYPGDELFVHGEASWVDSDWLEVTVTSSVTGLPHGWRGFVHRDYVSAR